MIHVAVMAVALVLVQDSAEGRILAASKSLDRAQRQFRMSLIEMGPDAIPELEKKVEGPHKEIIKQAIDEIRRLKALIEKLIAQLASEEVLVRDQATAELAKIGRPARPYLEKLRSRAEAEVQARVDKLLGLLVAPVRSELEMIRAREKEEIQHLRVKVMEVEIEQGLKSTLELVRARQALERLRYRNDSIPLDVNMNSIRDLLAKELELVDRRYGAGAATTAEVLTVPIQLLYADRRIGKEVSAEINRAYRDLSGYLRLQVSRGLTRDLDALDQILELSTDRNEDLD